MLNHFLSYVEANTHQVRNHIHLEALRRIRYPGPENTSPNGSYNDRLRCMLRYDSEEEEAAIFEDDMGWETVSEDDMGWETYDPELLLWGAAFERSRGLLRLSDQSLKRAATAKGLALLQCSGDSIAHNYVDVAKSVETTSTISTMCTFEHSDVACYAWDDTKSLSALEVDSRHPFPSAPSDLTAVSKRKLSL